MENIAKQTKSTIMPALRYRDAAAAIEWLCKVLGFERRVVYPGPDDTIGHAELTLGGGMLMLGSQKDDEHSQGFKSPEELGGVETGGTYVLVAEIESSYERAQSAGAKIIRPLQNTEYGSREFSVKDPEGHTWTLGTYDPWLHNG